MLFFLKPQCVFGGWKSRTCNVLVVKIFIIEERVVFTKYRLNLNLAHIQLLGTRICHMYVIIIVKLV